MSRPARTVRLARTSGPPVLPAFGVVLASGVLAAFAVVAAFASLALPGIALAADPTATPTPATGGDPRSPGQGPGFVGAPLLAIAAVLAVGLVTVLVTLAYVRLTAGRDRPGHR